MPSLSAVERGNPPPRRKSCLACTKAKRRCDLAQPACLRCTQRKLDCRYAPNVSKAAARNAAAAAAPAGPDGVAWPRIFEEKQAATYSYLPDTISPSDLHRHDGPGLTDESASTPSDTCLSRHTMTVDSGLDTSGFCAFDSDPSILDFTQDMSLPTLDQLSPSAICFDQPTISPGTLDMVWQPREVQIYWESIPIAVALSSRLQYTIDLVKGAPKRMVDELETPWCHPLLYRDETPRSMQDAVASCALYTAKNPRNSYVILHSIGSRFQEVLAGPSPTRPIEILARVHALMLYVIMFIFDGDHHGRAAADAAIPVLESAAMDLTDLFGHTSSIADSESMLRSLTPDSLPLHPLGPAREYWKNWIRQESARRTFLMVFFILQLYRMLKGETVNQCDHRLLRVHYWTISSHLWRATDAYEFALAWREKKHFIVTRASMVDVVLDARPDDIEMFGRMLLTTMMGIDEAKGWLHSRGGSL